MADTGASKFPILDEIEIPANVLANWQATVDLLAQIAGVPAALIMRTHAHEIEVFAASGNPDNVYLRGEKAPLDMGRYCETVMSTRRELLVPNALQDAAWDHNPDMSLGAISYFGLPLTWPGGEIFGTICLLDKKKNTYDQIIRLTLERFRDSVQFSLAKVYESSLAGRQADATAVQLHESEGRFRQLFDLARTPILLATKDGDIRLVNRRFSHLFGFAAEEIPTADALWLRAFPDPGYRARLRGIRDSAVSQAVAQGGDIAPVECEVTCKNGEIRAVELSGAVLGNDILLVFFDLTEHRRTEAALRASEARLNQAQRIAKIGYWELDIASNILTWSDEIFRIFELDPGKFGASYEAFLNAIHPEDREAVNRAYLSSLETRTPYSLDHRLRFVDGRLKHVHEQCETTFDADGRPIRSIGTVQDITERKRVEASMDQLNRQQQLILQTAAEGIVGLDEQGKVTFVNAAAARMLGYESLDLVGRKSHDTWHHSYGTGDPLPEAECAICATWRDGVAHRVANEVFWRKDGTNFPVEYAGRPIVEQGRVSGAVVTFTDITERNRTDEALRKTNRALNLLNLFSHELIRATDEKSLLQSACRHAVDAGGYRMAWIGFAESDEAKSVRPVAQAGFVAGYLDAAYITWADVERGRGPVGTATRTGQTVVVRDITSDTSFHVWCAAAVERGYRSVIALPLRSGDRCLGALNLYSAQRDAFDDTEVALLTRLAEEVAYGIVTLRQRAEHQRKESILQARARLSVYSFSHSLDELLTRTLDEAEVLTGSTIGFFHFVDADQKTLQLQNWSTNTLKTACTAEGKGRHYPVEQAGVWADALRERRPVIHNDYASLVHRKGLPTGHAPVLSQLVVPLLRNEQVVALVGVGNKPDAYEPADVESVSQLIELAWDLVQARQAESEIRRLNAELEERVVQRTAELQRANKELEAFSHSVSHDLRAPLRAIDGFSKILLHDYSTALDDQGRSYLARVRAASQHMSELIDAMIDLSRTTRMAMRRVRVDLSAVAGEIAMELHGSEPARKVRWVIAPDLAAIGDPDLLHIVLQNLLDNAWKFTRHCPEALIEAGVAPDRTEPVFFVRDNGAGFDMAYVDKLFHTFQRLHSPTEFPGTGVGLATVQRIISRHGGRVWAEGTVNHGATFYFTLPPSTPLT